MSASASTRSPATRFAGKRPSSTEGETLSTMTRRRPSKPTSAMVPARCELYAFVQGAPGGEGVMERKQQALRPPVAQARLHRQHVLVARGLPFGPIEQGHDGRPWLSEMSGGPGAGEGDRGDRAVLAKRAISGRIETLQQRIRFGPAPLALEIEGLVERVAPTQPTRRVLALRGAVHAQQHGDD